jgi:quinol monooxygenase YgiN
MYGTIARLKVKHGQEQNLIDLFNQWEKQRKPQVKGAIGGFLMKPDKGAAGDYIAVAIFKDKQAYMANADDPAQDEWYRKMRDLLTADPAWEDGEYVAGGVG